MPPRRDRGAGLPWHAAVLGCALALVATPTGARHPKPPALDTCGAAKLATAGDACRALFAARAKLTDPGARQAKVATIALTLGQAWSKAEAAAAGADCVAPTSTAAAATAEIDAAIAAFDAPLGGTSPCRTKRLGIAGAACRALLRDQAGVLRRAHGDPAAPDPGRVRIRRRFATRWKSAPCASPVDADSAGAALLEVVARAAGNATTLALREVAAGAGLLVGAAVEPEYLAQDPPLGPTFAREFDSLTAENKMKWELIQPEPGRYDFGPADALVDFATQHGMRVRGHNLFWGRLQLPDYVKNAATPVEARTLLTNHITTVAGRYAGRVAQWDVVNEPLTLLGDPGTTDGLDDHVMLQQLGPGYIAEALALAHAADPAAKLYVNDFLVEAPGRKQDRLVQLARDLLAAGAPLDGIGIQAHVGLSGFPSGAVLEASLRRFTDLGLEVELTEVDVPIVGRPGDTAARLAFQRDYYRALFAACLAVPGCRGVTTWGISDRYSWLRSFGSPYEIPLLLGDALERKPAYFGARGALVARTLAR